MIERVLQKRASLIAFDERRLENSPRFILY